MSNPFYLRDRPFLVIETYHKPAKNVRTERKGWHKLTGNWDAKEIPSVVRRISDKMLRRATVIIDIERDVLVKNRYSDSPANDVRKHYLSRYASLVA